MVEGLAMREGNDGEFLGSTFEIRIDADLALPEFIHTLGHEMIHATINRLHLQFKSSREEELCEQMLAPLLEELDVMLTTDQIQKYLRYQSSRKS